MHDPCRSGNFGDADHYNPRAKTNVVPVNKGKHAPFMPTIWWLLSNW
jgi:hypothetical protein